MAAASILSAAPMASTQMMLSSRRATVPGGVSAAAAFSRPRVNLAAGAFRGKVKVAVTTRAVLFPRTTEQQRTIDRLEAILPHTPSPTVRRPLMAGNWKMNPNTLEEAVTLAKLVAAAARADGGASVRNCDVLVVPPAPFLSAVAAILAGTGVSLGAQNVYHEKSGAYTGEMSLSMAISVGCDFILVGHSERRELFGEADDVVGRKTRAILDSGLKAVVCIGESATQYKSGQVRTVCAAQLEGALAAVTEEEIVGGKIVIAYEPVWAIGTGLTATPAIAQSVHAYIRSWVSDRFGAKAAAAVRIQYGGSVKANSVDELMQCPDVDGCLVGGAALSSDQFSRIFGFNANPPGPKKLWAEEVIQCKNELGESPVWDVESNTLYWVDAPGQALWSWDLTHEPVKAELGETVGCVALRANGTLLLGLEDSGIVAYDPRTRAKETLCAFEPGLNTRPNDGRVDRHGNFIIGSYNKSHRMDAHAIGGVYQLAAGSRRLTEVLDYKIRCSNATAFTPDGRTMFFCDSPTRRVYVFDYDPRHGPTNRRLLYELPSDVDGVPDGAQCDADGCLWIAISGASQCIRLGRDGNVDFVIELPVKCPTSLTFGGRDLDTIFITTRGPDGGSLYAVRAPPGLKGVPEVAFGDATPVMPRAGTAGGMGMGGSGAAG
eukprot:CAMPEP_0197590938 /NCGR_PEP_ID=MMETSP1326-20131121/12306_1 /TAXON_ID=1155430 /ORGANISM="Genus nov. species nov., Strain RCC2288" /LENGTH=660 /DNA_ID=CAMNT_0043156253 /DNA_START=110 /DNA_END=2089 /DNA_ORIENTATION=+